MWTPAARAELVRASLPYATCLSDAEWAVLAPLLPTPVSIGRPWRWPVREILDGVLYVLRTGCAWRYLPLGFRPWSTVHRWFSRLSQAGVFERLAHALTMADRERVGCGASPTGCVVDAQAARSGRVGVAGERGYDPARRIIGRRRDAPTDTDGRLLVAGVSTADLQDSHGGTALLPPRANSSPSRRTVLRTALTEAGGSARPRPSWSRSSNRKPGRASPFSPGVGN